MTVKLDNNDLLIGINEDSVDFNDLNNVLRIENYLNSQQEGKVKFSDDEEIKLYELIKNLPTENDDTLEYGNESDIIDSLAEMILLMQGMVTILFLQFQVIIK